MSSVGLVQTHHHQSACLGGNMLGHGFHYMNRTSNLWQKSLSAPWEAKSCSASEKCYSLSASLGLCPHPRAVVRMLFCFNQLDVGCFCEDL